MTTLFHPSTQQPCEVASHQVELFLSRGYSFEPELFSNTSNHTPLQQLVNLNTCSFRDLSQRLQLTPSIGLAIMASRPFLDTADLISRVQIPSYHYERIVTQITFN